MKNIFTIVKKELRGYFNHPTAYILLVVFLSIIYFFYFRPVLITGETTLRPLFDILPWILMFYVPAVTMGLVAKEKNDGTLEILMTQPIKPWQIIIGKALSAFLFISFSLLITLSIPFSLAHFGDFDYGLIFSQYLGSLFLIAGLVAIGFWASAITKNQIIAFISSMAVNFLLIFIGFEMVTTSLPYPFNLIFKKVSILGHFYNIARGVLDLRDVIYFICLIIIFLFLSYQAFLRMRGGRLKIYKKFNNLIILLLVVALIVNLSGNFISGRIDLTQGKIFTLSSSTKNIISNLSTDLTINLFISKKLPAQITSQAQDVKDLLADYVALSNGKIKLKIYHPDSDSQAKTLAEQQGIPPVQFNVIAKDEFQAKQGYLGLSIVKMAASTASDSTSSKTQTADSQRPAVIPFIQRTDNLEYQLSSFIWQLTKTETKKVVWLTGHGEKSLWQDFPTIQQELSKEYQLTSLDLASPQNKNSKKELPLYQDIPADTAVLVIAGPQEAISAAELGKINYYLQHGGSALILARSFDVNLQSMTATSTAANLNLMLNEWGVKVDRALAYDLKSNENVTLRGRSVNYILPYPLWLRALASPHNNVLGNLKAVILPWASPLELIKNKLKKDTKVIPLLTTSKYAGKIGPAALDISPQRHWPSDNLSSQLLAVALENKFNGRLSRLLVVGNSQFSTEQFLSNSPANAVFMLNAIEWLSQDQALAAIRSKNLSRAPLLFTSDSQRQTVKYLNVIGIPLLVILAGVLILWRRRKISHRTFVV